MRFTHKDFSDLALIAYLIRASKDPQRRIPREELLQQAARDAEKLIEAETTDSIQSR